MINITFELVFMSMHASVCLCTLTFNFIKHITWKNSWSKYLINGSFCVNFKGVRKITVM